MSEQPLVSIITPSHGRPQFLPLIYGCVKAQQMGDYEWLVLDDSPAPSEFMATLADPRVVYMHVPDRLSIGKKRNMLVERARGEIIAHFDDDDFYAEHYLIDMLGAFFENKADFIKLDSFFLFSLIHDVFAYWNLRDIVGPHYLLGNELMQLVNFDETNNAIWRDNYLGYGFAYLYRKEVWRHVQFPDQDWNEDAIFARGALERFGVLGIDDTDFVALHILHAGNSSRCIPQNVLPGFLRDTLFPGINDYLAAIGEQGTGAPRPATQARAASSAAPPPTAAVAPKGRARICLNMIVKDEAHVIRRCLASVKDVIDYWIIVDTGSSDGTQGIIRDFMRDVPGELLERPWVDFGRNRSEAIEAARDKGDYLLFIDADEVLERDRPFPPLDKDYYRMKTRLGAIAYDRVQLVNARLRWRFVGVVHEYPWCPEARSEGVLEGMRIKSAHEGSRSRDPLKFRKDAALLETALEAEPDNLRYVFYLAQSYREAGELERAIGTYERRLAMAGWIDERWYSQYQIAVLKERRMVDWQAVLAEYLKAFELCPDRAEPLFAVARHYMEARQFETADMFLARAARIPYPSGDRLFVEHEVYRFSIPIEQAVCAYWLGRHGDAVRINNALLQRSDLPEAYVEMAVRNRRSSLDAMHPPPAAAEPGAASRIAVVVPFSNPGPNFRKCVESLLEQEGLDFEMLFIDDGSTDGSIGVVPVGMPRVRLIRGEKRRGIASTIIGDFARAPHPDGDGRVVVGLEGGDWLADAHALRRVGEIYAATGCRAMYSQYRHGNGARGQALPYADAASFSARIGPEYRPGLMSWRADAMASLGTDALRPGAGLDALFDRIIEGVGFAATYFADDALCVRASA